MNKQQFENLKVGDKVRIVSVKECRNWNDNGLMDKWLGKIMTVRMHNGYTIKMVEDQKEWSDGWNWYAKMIAEKVVAPEIHITVDGNKTIAVLKEGGKVVKRAEAKCSTEDPFDFETGAYIALKRVFGNDVKVSDDGKVFLHKKGKPEFKPHLVSRNTGYYYGVIGDETNFKDAIGRALFVGDSVELYDASNVFVGERAIVKDEQRTFVMSIKASSDSKEGTTGRFKIIKKRSFEDIKDGECVDDIRYIKTKKVGD